MLLYQIFQGGVAAVPCKPLIPSMQLLDIAPLAMHQYLHVYYMNMLDPTPWAGTILLRFKNMTTPQQLRNFRVELPRVIDGGWHFSYMGGVDRVIKKMHSIVEGRPLIAKDVDNLTNRNYIEQLMNAGKDPYDRKGPGSINCRECRLEDIKLPTLNWFVEKYPHFVRK